MHNERDCILLPSSVAAYLMQSSAGAVKLYLALSARIVDYHNPTVTIGAAALAAATGLSPRAVFLNLQHLEADGQITRSHAAAGSANTVTLTAWTRGRERQQTQAAPEGDCIRNTVAGTDDPRLTSPVSAGARDTNVHGQLAAIGTLIARIYRPVDELEELVQFAGDVDTLRAGLQSIEAAGGVAADMPFSFFLAVLGSQPRARRCAPQQHPSPNQPQ